MTYETKAIRLLGLIGERIKNFDCRESDRGFLTPAETWARFDNQLRMIRVKRYLRNYRRIRSQSQLNLFNR